MSENIPRPQHRCSSTRPGSLGFANGRRNVCGLQSSSGARSYYTFNTKIYLRGMPRPNHGLLAGGSRLLRVLAATVLACWPAWREQCSGMRWKDHRMRVWNHRPRRRPDGGRCRPQGVEGTGAAGSVGRWRSP